MSASEIKGPEIKGWCPGALRPMESGDGWLVRIRPPGGVLTPAQAAGIAQASQTHGNGMLDLSSRANLQLRGVRRESHPALIDDLSALGLIDADIGTETLRNLIVTPFRTGPPTPTLPHKGGREAPSMTGAAPGDRLPPSPPWGGDGGGGPLAGGIDALAATLTAALARMPSLPGKFGFALDTGPQPVLARASADIRVERGADGRLILRPDGHPFGRPVTDLADDVIALAQWFVAAGGMAGGRGRMAALIGKGIIPTGYDTPAADPQPAPLPGPHADGALVAFAFGQIRADTLGQLATLGHDLRPTPWRMILIAGARTAPDLHDLITHPDDPLLRVTACTGAPGCAQAHRDTRALARALAPYVARHLHVSGCTKGCAHPGATETTLVATPNGYDLIRGGCASDAPHLTDQPPHQIAAALKAHHAP